MNGDQIGAHETHQLRIAKALRFAKSLQLQFLDAPRVSGVEHDREIVECSGDHRRVRCSSDLDRSFEVLAPTHVAQELLRRANRRQRMHLQVYEAEVLGHRQRFLRGSQSALLMRVERLMSSRPGQNVRDTRGSIRPFDQGLGGFQVGKHLVLLSAKPEHPRKERLGLCGDLGPSRLDERVARSLEGFSSSLVARDEECVGEAEEQLGALLVVGPESECPLRTDRKPRETHSCEPPVACCSGRDPCMLDQVVGARARGLVRGRARHSNGTRELRVVVPAAETSIHSPPTVPHSALRTRDLPVGDVPQQHVRERPLSLALDRGAALAGEEALALEGVQKRRRLFPLCGAHPSRTPFP